MIRRTLIALTGATALALFPVAVVWAIDGDNTAGALALLASSTLAFVATALQD
jgi:hypothetical protein